MRGSSIDGGGFRELVAPAAQFLNIKEENQMSARELADSIADYLNSFGNKQIDELVKELSKQHRTLQQRFTQLCINWFQELANRRFYDDRNKASVELAKKIITKLDDRDFYLPLI